MRLVQDTMRRAARAGSPAGRSSSSEKGSAEAVTPIAVAAARRDGASTAATAGAALIEIGDITTPGTVRYNLKELQDRVDALEGI